MTVPLFDFSELLRTALAAAYLLVPGYAANITPVLAAKLLPRWSAPLDGGATLGGQPVFGSHKTWRGLAFGVAAAVLVAGLQAALAGDVAWLGAQAAGPWYVLGLLLGGGALLGDAAKSFLKRRLGRPPGAPWVPFDELDHAVGALALVSFVYFPGWLVVGVGLAVTFIGHVALNLIGYRLKLKDVPW